MSIDIKVVASATGVLSKETLGISFLNCSIELKSLIPELTSNVNVGGLGSHGESNDKCTFDKFVRIMSHDFSVLACSWLRLICVNHQVRWPNQKVINY